MKPTLLRNETGGHKRAYMQAELDADLARGWVVVDEEAKPEPVKVPEKIDRRRKEHRANS